MGSSSLEYENKQIAFLSQCLGRNKMRLQVLPELCSHHLRPLAGPGFDHRTAPKVPAAQSLPVVFWSLFWRVFKLYCITSIQQSVIIVNKSMKRHKFPPLDRGCFINTFLYCFLLWRNCSVLWLSETWWGGRWHAKGFKFCFWLRFWNPGWFPVDIFGFWASWVTGSVERWESEKGTYK